MMPRPMARMCRAESRQLLRQENCMFHRTVSLWRRLIGTAGAPQSAAAVAEERRQSARYPTDLVVHYRDASGERPELAAQLRDVSAGGISLLAERPAQPGDLLSIRLPGRRA